MQKKFYNPDLHNVDWDFYKKEYKKFVKEVLTDILDDKIAYEKDKKKLKKLPIKNLVTFLLKSEYQASTEMKK